MSGKSAGGVVAVSTGQESEIAREGPIFFLSYAHSKPGRGGRRRGPNPNVTRLFDDLSVHVSEMVPLRGGVDPGFMDRSMGGGERWNEELLTAVGTCQVFVALISPPYVQSRWCALEWDAFARRPVTRRSPTASTNGTTILPVIWVPPPATLPKAVSDVQTFTPKDLPGPEIEAGYHGEGLYGLRTMGFTDDYDAVVWRLAQRIVTLLGQLAVQPRIPSGADELVNVFQDEG